MASHFGDTPVMPGMAFCLSPSAVRRWRDVSDAESCLPGVAVERWSLSIYREKCLFAFGLTKPWVSPVHLYHACTSLAAFEKAAPILCPGRLG